MAFLSLKIFAESYNIICIVSTHSYSRTCSISFSFLFASRFRFVSQHVCYLVALCELCPPDDFRFAVWCSRRAIEKLCSKFLPSFYSHPNLWLSLESILQNYLILTWWAVWIRREWSWCFDGSSQLVVLPYLFLLMWLEFSPWARKDMFLLLN